jgi:hypothetical protein
VRLSFLKIALSSLLLLCVTKGVAQEVILSGYIREAASDKALPGCTVFVEAVGRGTSADTSGFYNLTLPAGRYEVAFSFMGYRREIRHIDLQSSQRLNISLQSETTTLSEVEVTSSHPDESLTSTETGHIILQKKDIEKLPYLLGEVDPIRMLQLMPGVQTSGEGSTGFYVRGGAVDQNLMLLDHSTVYNPSHLFGFFSIFNGSTVQNLEMYKSGIPSNYGGRLSSVTKVTTRSGNDQLIKGQAGLGAVAANFLVEGPLKKNKSSFLFAARRTYVDMFARGLRELNLVKKFLNYYFYDININVDYKLSPRDRLFVRTYYGKDDFNHDKVSFSNVITWKNKTGSLTWQHAGKLLFTDLSIHASGYDMSLGANISTYAFNIKSDIKDVGITYQFQLATDRHDLSWGFDYTRHSLRPNNVSAASDNVAFNLGTALKLKADEASLFVSDRVAWTDRLEMNVGLRLSAYSQLGSFTRYIEDDHFQILDTVSYGKNKRIKNYYNFEPRVAFRYSLTPTSSFKISYDKTVQYMHMAPLSSVSLPLDIWVPSSSVIKPQVAHQFSAGYSRNFHDNQWETSVVLYYKNMQRQIEYRDGVIIGYSKGFNYDDSFVFGHGTSYGSEFSVRKPKGRISGQLSYTLSRTTRTFKDLNSGRSFSAKYDRLHDLSVLTNFDLNSKWTFSSVFVYGTGNALNLPIARYVLQENVINEYGARNSFRMPAYHRLDLAATFTGQKKSRWQSFWVFSVYNVYSRRNPYYIYFETEGNLEEPELKTSIKQVSLFPIIPTITYRIEF